jgi:hypothetical protein
MGIDWKALATKAGRWLLARGTEEVEKEAETQIEKRRGDPARRTGPTSPPAIEGRPPWDRTPQK